MNLRKLGYGIFLLMITSFSYIKYFQNYSKNSNKHPIPNSSTQGDILWEETWVDDSRFSGLWGDESYVYTCGSNSGDLNIIKWDKNGNLVWNKTWGDELESEKSCGIWGNEQNLYVCGYANEEDVFITKWAKNGTIVWSQQWNASMIDSYSAELRGDTDFLYLCGTFLNSSTHVSTVQLLKWDFEGNSIWNTTLQTDNIKVAGRIYVDDQFIYVIGSAEYHGFLTKWNKSGDLIWNTSINGNGGWDVIVDENYIYTFEDRVSSSITSYYPRSRVFTTKWDENSSQIWIIQANSDVTYTVSLRPIPLRLWVDQSTIYTCENQRTFSGYGYTTNLLLKAYLKNSTHLWSSSWPTTGDNRTYVKSISIWGDDTYVYSSGHIVDVNTDISKYFLIKWDTQPHKPNIPVIAGLSTAGFIVVITSSWIILKPIHRIQRRKIQKLLEEITSNQYQGLYNNSKEIDEILPLVEKYGTSKQKSVWEQVRKKDNLNHTFQIRLQEIMKVEESSNVNTSYDRLMQLLHDANSPEYSDYIDPKIISDITDILKNTNIS